MELVDAMEADPELFAELQQDPEAVAERAGIELDDEDRAASRVAASLSSQELRERISKAAPC